MTHNVTGLVTIVRDYYPLSASRMYTKGGATSSHPSESLDGFHRRENGALHAAVETIVSEVVHVDSVQPNTVLWTFQRPLCLQKEMGSGPLQAASKNLLMASTRQVPSSTVEWRQRARSTTCEITEITNCRTPWPTSCLANIKMPMPIACGCWAGNESRSFEPTCKMTS